MKDRPKLTEEQNKQLFSQAAKAIIRKHIKAFNENKSNQTNHVHRDKHGVPIFNSMPMTGILLENDPYKSRRYLHILPQQEKHYLKAFRYIEHSHDKLNLQVICRLNSIVAYDSKYPGQITPIYVCITHMHYRPPMPNNQLAKKVIKKYAYDYRYSATERAIHTDLQIIRHQFFFTANRRTGWMTANYCLFHNRAGLLDIKPSQAKQWNHLRNAFYEDGKMNKVTNWLIHNCMYPKSVYRKDN